MSEKYEQEISKLQAENENLKNQLSHYLTIYQLSINSDHTLDGLIFHKNGICIEVNRAFCKITGKSREELIGKNLLDLISKNIDRKTFLNQKLISNSSEPYKINITKQDGAEIILEIQSKTFDYYGETYRISSVKDVTVRMQVEHDLKTTKEEAEKSQLLLSKQNKELENANQELKKAIIKAEESDKLKSSFLANMSHEIRTPMNGLIGFVELLVQDNLSEEKKHVYKKVVTDSCNRLLGIINDVLDISKLETAQYKVEIEEININEIILESYTLFLNQTKQKNLNFVTTKTLSDTQGLIKTDGQKLKQIFHNLLGNSIKFTHQGKIELGYRVVNNNESIEFYISDTGIGIPESELNLVFDRFRQVDNTSERKYGGTGLGLAIAKGFVELLGGNIRCESEIGKGSSFIFTIPYVSDYKEIETPDPLVIPEQKTKKFKILVVDDEEINFLYIEEILLRMDNISSTCRASNGVESINMVYQDPDIDLVLMDIKMPVMDGYEATRELKKIRPGLPIIAQTAYAMHGDENLCLEAGCDYYISKPIQKNKLIGVINSFLLKK